MVSRAGFHVTGFDALKRNVEKLSEEILNQAVDAAEDAAAQVYKRALEQAAPVGESGDLSESITIYESKDRKALFRGKARRRLLVGPSKRKGFYGFWLEFGTSKMAARPWARPAVDAVHGEAQAAGRAAFEAYLTTQVKQVRP